MVAACRIHSAGHHTTYLGTRQHVRVFFLQFNQNRLRGGFWQPQWGLDMAATLGLHSWCWPTTFIADHHQAHKLVVKAFDGCQSQCGHRQVEPVHNSYLKGGGSEQNVDPLAGVRVFTEQSASLNTFELTRLVGSGYSVSVGIALFYVYPLMVTNSSLAWPVTSTLGFMGTIFFPLCELWHTTNIKPDVALTFRVCVCTCRYTSWIPATMSTGEVSQNVTESDTFTFYVAPEPLLVVNHCWCTTFLEASRDVCGDFWCLTVANAASVERWSISIFLHSRCASMSNIFSRFVFAHQHPFSLILLCGWASTSIFCFQIANVLSIDSSLLWFLFSKCASTSISLVPSVFQSSWSFFWSQSSWSLVEHQSSWSLAAS